MKRFTIISSKYVSWFSFLDFFFLFFRTDKLGNVWHMAKAANVLGNVDRHGHIKTKNGIHG